MNTTIKIALAAAGALLIGLLLGFFIGRAMLESKWSQPYAVVSPGDATKYASEDADPTAPAGTKILGQLPLGKARLAIADLTKNDPAKVAYGTSFGQGNEGVELHVTVENTGKCTIKEGHGVAYGYDAHGKSGAANKHKEHYVAFKIEKPIEPGKKDVISAKMRYADDVTIALAHVDATTCTDGTSWKRQ